MEQKHFTKMRCLSVAQFMPEMQERIHRIKHTGQSVTLITLDFDHFNYVNDLYGYEVGDRVLEEICRHFEQTLQEDDFFCRQHADHFLICLQTGDVALASRIFTRLTDLKARMDTVLSHHYTLAASGGILVVQSPEVPLPALIDRANCARKVPPQIRSTSMTAKWMRPHSGKSRSPV